MTAYRIAVLPGDGVGPEVVAAARTVLDAVTRDAGLELEFSEYLVGGAAIEAYDTPLRDTDLAACRTADAILLGAVGGPEWDHLPVGTRPERALLRLRAELGLGINLRPVAWTPAGEARSPLRAEVAAGADIAFVRELTGGVYFGRPSHRGVEGTGRFAVDTAYYTEAQITAVLRFAFELARRRGGKVTSVDKANVMNTSRLWREVATEYGRRHPEIELEHALVDSFAMSLMREPRRYDVVVTENLFGDILTDLAAVLAGSLGMLPSASLRPNGTLGMYEPIHGSAPDIRGQGIANPAGCILSAALMLEWSLGRPDLAERVRAAVSATLESGVLTADMTSGEAAGTNAFTSAVLGALQKGGVSRGRSDIRYDVA